MKKTKYLVAALLLMGATTTFTSCIDNDEPAGIEELRGAKAELIKAKAQIALAQEAWVRSQVALQEVQKQLQEIAVESARIDLEIHKIDLDLKKNLLLRDNAFTASEIARYDALIAKYQKEKADHINAKNLAAEEFKKNMLIWQKATAMAEYEYQRCLEWIKAAWEVMSPAERDLLNMAEARLRGAARQLDSARVAYEEAYNDYIDALLHGDGEDGTTIESLARLQAELAQAEGKVRALNLQLAEEERLKGLAQDFVNVNWDAQLKELEQKVQVAKVRRDSAENALVQIKVADAYQAAEDTLELAINKLGDKGFKASSFDEKTHVFTDYKITDELTPIAGQKSLKVKKDEAKAAYEAALVGGTKGEAVMEIKTIATAPFSAALREQLKNTKVTFKNVAGNFDIPVDENIFDKDGKLVIGQAKYIQDQINKDAENKTNNAYPNYQRVYYTNLLNSLEKFSVDGNGLKWAETEKAGLLEEKKPIAEKYDAAKNAWQLVVDVYTGKTVNNVVAPKEFNDAVADYNKAFGELTKSVEAYNKLYNTVYDAGYNKSIKDQKDDFYVGQLALQLFDKTSGYLTGLPVVGGATSYEDLWKDPKTPQTVETLETYLKQVQAATDKYKTDNKIDEAWEGRLAKNVAVAKGALDYHFKKDNVASTTGGSDKDNDGVNDFYFDMIKNAHGAGLANIVKNQKDVDKAENAIKAAYGNVMTEYANIQNKGIVEFDDVARKDYAQKRINQEVAKIMETVTGKDSDPFFTHISETPAADVKVNPVTKDIVANKASYAMTDKRTAIDTKVMAEQMTTERLPMKDAKVILADKSQTAFGKIAWQPEVNEYRFVEPTTADIDKYLADVKADTKDKQDAVLKGELGAFGELEWINREIAYCDSMMNVEADVTPAIEAVKGLLAELDAQVKAEYDKKIQPAVDKMKATEAKYNEGKEAVKVAKAAIKAMVAEEEANIKSLSYNVQALEAVLADLRAQLAPLAPVKPVEGAKLEQYASSFLEYWTQKVETTKIEIAKAEEQVTLVKKEIELNESGNTNDAARIERQKQRLENAKQYYDAASKDYNETLQEFHNLVDNLAAARK